MRRTPRSKKVPQQRSAFEFSTSAPYKGLNDIQPLGAMDPTYAIILDNFIAEPRGPSVRQGSKAHVTGFDDESIDAPVTSFIRYNGRTSSDNALFAVAGGDIYDVTSQGEVGDPVVSDLSTTNVYWQSTQQTYTQANHSYVVAVNGVDAPLIYNGTWTTCSQVESPDEPGEFTETDKSGNSVDIADFNDVITHQQRLWFVCNDSTKAYYTNIGVVGGQLFAFDFGAYFTRGGALHKLATWTLDSGGTSGIQAILVAISTNGDVVIYKGTDPSTASSWGLVGTYQLGPPVGKRCTQSLQGDLLYLSQDGLYPLSRYLKTARIDDVNALTYPITNTITRLISENGTLPGFELEVFPDQNLLLLNIPQAGSNTNHQYVMNTITNGWSRLTGWPAHCLTVFNNKLYFGTDANVMQAYYGAYTDNADVNGENGEPIVANALSAFSAFDEQQIGGLTKQITGIKPFFTLSAPVLSIGVGVNVDFSEGEVPVSSVIPPLPATGSLWGTALWNQAYWTGSSAIGQTYFQWFSPSSKPGIHVAVAIAVSTRSYATWAKTQWRVKGGFSL